MNQRKYYLVLLMGWWLFSTGVAGAAPLTVQDADNSTITLNELGKISVVISSNQGTQQLTRDTGQLLDVFQGQKDFREMVLVDLRNSLGNMIPSFVRMQMRSNLDKEARRIQPFFLLNGNKENPRLYTHAIPDFDGKISDQLGWTKPDNLVRVVVFDRAGQDVYRWGTEQEKGALVQRVKALLLQ